MIAVDIVDYDDSKGGRISCQPATWLRSINHHETSWS